MRPDVGFPFDAIDTQKYKFHCVAITPRHAALGWDSNGYSEGKSLDQKIWTLAPKKKVLKSFVYQTDLGNLYMSTDYKENPEKWCEKNKYKLVKILDSIEVDID